MQIDAARFRAAAGRPQHPLAGPAARAGGAPAPLQARGGARLRPRQPLRPADLRPPGGAARHRHDRQVVHGRAPGARRPGHRRGRGGAARPAGPTRSAWSGRSSRRRLRAFAEGLEKIIVVEEKRGLIESQLKEVLYGRTGAPAIVGKRDEQERPLVPLDGALDQQPDRRSVWPAHPARWTATSRSRRGSSASSTAAHRAAAERRSSARPISAPAARTTPRPGCPRAASRWPASAAITWRSGWTASTAGYTQMGGEGADWVGEAPFVEAPHVFQNIGDGTYYHSGLLAIRAAIAAGVNITYKILFNDAVAMTGGQHVDGPLDAPQITREVAAEGVQPGRRGHRRAGQVPAERGLRAGHDDPSPRRARRGAARAARDRGHHASWSTTRPAPPRSAAGASAAR